MTGQPENSPVRVVARHERDGGQEVLPATEAITVTRTLDRWRLLRLVCGLQGGYYLITGLWPLLHRFVRIPALFSATNLLSSAYATETLLALTALIGAILALAATRPRPDGLIVGLGAGTALAFFIMEWRFRANLRRVAYLDLALELVFIVALLLIFGAAYLAERRQRR